MHSSSLSISIVCDLTYELYVQKYALGKLVMESFYDEWFLTKERFSDTTGQMHLLMRRLKQHIQDQHKLKQDKPQCEEEMGTAHSQIQEVICKWWLSGER